MYHGIEYVSLNEQYSIN